MKSYLIEISDEQLLLLSEHEFNAMNTSNEEFDGFDGYILKGTIECSEKVFNIIKPKIENI